MIKIGKLVNTHALKGEVKIKSYTDFYEERFKKGNTIYVLFENQYLPLIVSKTRLHKDLIYANFEGYDHINKIEKYKSCDLYVKKDEIHELEEDEYYFHELVGCKVFDPQYIGDVVEVLDYPAQQILVVSNDRIMIPFVEAFVKEIDIKNKIINVKLIEGMR